MPQNLTTIQIPTTTGIRVAAPLVSTQDSDSVLTVSVATEDSPGIVQPDGSTITVDENGVISASGGAGTVTDVTATAPILSSGGATPDISLSPGSQSADLSGSRAVNTVYQNTGTVPLVVMVTTASGTYLIVNSDDTVTPSTSVWADIQTAIISASGMAIVQPGNYYEVLSDGILSTWFESTLF